MKYFVRNRNLLPFQFSILRTYPNYINIFLIRTTAHSKFECIQTDVFIYIPPPLNLQDPRKIEIILIRSLTIDHVSDLPIRSSKEDIGIKRNNNNKKIPRT